MRTKHPLAITNFRKIPGTVNSDFVAIFFKIGKCQQGKNSNNYNLQCKFTNCIVFQVFEALQYKNLAFSPKAKDTQ